MRQDKETRNKLLQSAREEFMEKGYMKASLRNICRNAGVTTGALYFFFQDKEDLFESLTKETVEGIFQVMKSHFQDESDMMQKGMGITPEAKEVKEDFAAAQAVIHQLYRNREDALLVLTKAQGTKYENIADLLISTAENHHRAMARGMMAVYPGVVLDDKFIHWLAHEMIDAFIYMVTHIEEEEEAVRFISQAITYMMAGWYGLFINR